MFNQKLFPFKIKLTKDTITPRSGLVLFSEFFRAFGIKNLVETYMPKPGSNRGYRPWQYIEPILLMLIGGGKHIEDLKEIIEDKGLRKLINLESIPSTSTVGDWLRRQGRDIGLEALKKVIELANIKALKLDTNTEYTLFSDPTIISADKESAKMTYLGVKGYRPIITIFKEFPLICYHEFREGNTTGGVLSALRGAYKVLPPGKRIACAFLDSEFYRADVMKFLREKGTNFAISADKDIAVKEAIKWINNWRPFRDRDGILTDREIGETVHAMNKLDFGFRLIVLRWKRKQVNLFEGEYFYHCIATDLKCSAEEVVWRYNERANIENVIKELKNGFGMEYMPTGDFFANSFWFSLGVLAYNCFIIKKYLVLPKSFRDKTIQSIRWLFVEVAGKVVEHARKLYLKISAVFEKLILFNEIRYSFLRL